MEQSNAMELIQTKKNILCTHVAFLKEMLSKFHEPQITAKWEHMMNCITSDHKM
jgi:hypothetical protein